MIGTDFGQDPFTYADLERIGITPAGLRRALGEHTVRRLLRGVFVGTTVEDSWELRARAVGLAVAPNHVICDRTAAWLYGVDVLGHAELQVLPPIETCALRWHPATERVEVRGRNRDLRPDDIAQVLGLRVTTPLRTALDLGCNLRRRDPLAALDQFRRHGVTADELAVGATRFAGRRGVVQLRALIPLCDPRAESVRESWTRLAILDAGLPPPELQFWVEVDGLPTYRLDHAYPRHRIAIEYDGEQFHNRTDQQRDRDSLRRQWLEEDGWKVIVVRAGDFTGARLDRWLADLKSALFDRPTNRRW